MLSKPIKRAYEAAREYENNLRSIDSRFGRCVQIIHEEGTTYFFRNAFLMNWKDPEHVYNPENASEKQGEWLIVFTEHQDIHVFSYDELFSYNEFVILEREIEEIEEI